MDWLRVLILIPFYFCGALAALPFLIVVARILRLKVGINPLVYSSIVLALLAIVVPLGFDLVDLNAYRGRVLLVLVLVSIFFGAVDWALKKSLPLPLDEELDHT